MRLAEDIVEIVLKDLKDRSGFDGWWGDIDEETQEQIEAALARKIAEHIERKVLD